jgi:hypothetical protein
VKTKDFTAQACLINNHNIKVGHSTTAPNRTDNQMMLLQLMESLSAIF